MSDEFAQLLLMYFLIPLWIAAGFADWICHRRSDIEHTAGVKETLIHLLMFVEVGMPLLAALLLDINALVIVVMISAFFIHEATALWDVSYAVSKRLVSPLEQHVHSFLEMLPLLAICIVCLVHQNQLLALVGMGNEAARFDVALKTDLLPTAYVVAFLAFAFVFNIVPYLNELWQPSRSMLAGPLNDDGDAAKRFSDFFSKSK